MSEPQTLGPRAAAALVFGSSAAVLVVELVMLRLLAPFLGLTLETNTLVIGLALASIAFGSWAGGRLADVVPPRRTLGPLLAASGVAVALTPFLVRGAGSGSDGSVLLLVAAATMFVPGAALSAVTPMVTKLRLGSLEQTGTVVGSLSGVGTTGAIAGTVLTGLVLVSRVPVSGILVGLGMLLVASSVVVDLRVRGWRSAVTPLVAVLLAGAAAAVAPGDCDAETVYHCAAVVVDPERPAGRTLVLDGVRHSYVDLEDPLHLEFAYVRAVAAVVDTAIPDGAALETYHLGGGGLTLPRWLEATRPGSRSLVSEIDAAVVRLDRELLALDTSAGITVRVEDGRLGLARVGSDSQHLVVGDAFGGVTVPWHLTTREALDEVRRVLTPDGVYVANLIDYGDLAFARAAVATLRDTFDHVTLAAAPATLAGEGGGNMVAVAGDRPVDAMELERHLEERATGWQVLDGAALDAWVGDAAVLTDDHAPVDQLLTPRPRPRALLPGRTTE